jgi:hypothetical protein
VKATTYRAFLVAAVTRDVNDLVRRNRFRDLEMVMEATGYLSNQTSQTTRSLGNAIIALASGLDLDWLEATAGVASFHRHYKGRDTAAWEHANASSEQMLTSLKQAAEVAS